MGRKEGVEAENLSASARLGVAGGHEGARRRRRACSVRWETAREGAGKSERGRADRDDTGAFIHAARGSRRWPGEAGGGRGSVGARHASPLFVLLAEEEEDKGEEEVGWAGQVGELGRLVGCTGEAR